MSKKVTMDIEFMNRMKAMESKKRDQIMSKNDVKMVSPSSSDLVEFDLWWAENSSKHKMKPWMKEIIKADFKGRGLGKFETREKFNECLKLFGVG